MMPPKFLIDECLSPELARRLIALEYDTTSARDRGRLAKTDSSILSYCIDEDRILVTQNADDFRKMVSSAQMHPGLIILSANARERSWRELEAALMYMKEKGREDVRRWMFNRVIEVRGGSVSDFELPSLDPVH